MNARLILRSRCLLPRFRRFYQIIFPIAPANLQGSRLAAQLGKPGANIWSRRRRKMAKSARLALTTARRRWREARNAGEVDIG